MYMYGVFLLVGAGGICSNMAQVYLVRQHTHMYSISTTVQCFGYNQVNVILQLQTSVIGMQGALVACLSTYFAFPFSSCY